MQPPWGSFLGRDPATKPGSWLPVRGGAWRPALLAVLLLVLLPASGAWAKDLAGRVVQVLDGDTLRLDSGMVVRLAGIDAPEMAHERDGRMQPDQYFARDARELLSYLVLGQEVRVRVLGRDHYGRTLGLVRLDPQTEVNQIMLERGAAYYLFFSGRPWGVDKRLLAAQVRAMQACAGFWPRITALPQGKVPWVGNRRSGRAFPAGSPEARKVSRAHAVSFSSLTEAFAKGYAPARQLTPWPPAGD